MQTILETHTPPPAAAAAVPRAIPVEWLAYILLAAFALALRLAALGDVPLSPAETHDALAAWRAVSPTAPGDPLTASSPALFLAQAIGFTTLGSTEFAARFFVALAGAFVCLSPALFRRQIGAPFAFVFALFLTLSPVLLAASRFASPVIFSALFAVLMLWCLDRFIRGRQQTFGVGIIVSAAALILLAERGGLTMFVIVALSVGIGWRWQARADARFTFDDEEETSEAPEPAVRGANIPIGLSLAVTALVVFLTATVAMLYPAGLSSVGEVLAGALGGFVTTPDSALALSRFSSLFYETFGWGLATAAVVVLARLDRFTLIDRILACWLFFGAVATAFYINGSAAHGLWTAIPIAGLVARLLLVLVESPSGVGEWDVPWWARYVVALIGVGALAVFTLAAQGIGRSLALSPDGALASAPVEPTSLILLIVVIMFCILAVFMAGTLWTMRTAARGIGLAFIVFGALTSLGSGWRLSVPESTLPFHLWHTHASAVDNVLLADTLRDVAERESRGFDLVSIHALAAQDGLVAWHTRTYQNTVYITDLAQAAGQPVVLIDRNIVPELGGAYVGQDFTITREWSPATLQITDILSWWTQNRVGPVSGNSQFLGTAYLWLRQDIWQGVQ